MAVLVVPQNNRPQNKIKKKKVSGIFCVSLGKLWICFTIEREGISGWDATLYLSCLYSNIENWQRGRNVEDSFYEPIGGQNCVMK